MKNENISWAVCFRDGAVAFSPEGRAAIFMTRREARAHLSEDLYYELVTIEPVEIANPKGREGK